MYYITDMMLGLICIYVSCLNLITARLNLLKKCGLFLFILLSALILDKPLGQLSGLFVIAGILFLLYHWSSHQWLDLSCALFGYLLMVSCNYVYIWVIQAVIPAKSGFVAEHSRNFSDSRWHLLFSLLCINKTVRYLAS